MSHKPTSKKRDFIDGMMEKFASLGYSDGRGDFKTTRIEREEEKKKQNKEKGGGKEKAKEEGEKENEEEEQHVLIQYARIFSLI